MYVYLFINVSRSNKYMCIVTNNCSFKLLYNLGNSVNTTLKIQEIAFQGFQISKFSRGSMLPDLPKWLAPLARDCPPNFNALAPLPPLTTVFAEKSLKQKAIFNNRKKHTLINWKPVRCLNFLLHYHFPPQNLSQKSYPNLYQPSRLMIPPY